MNPKKMMTNSQMILSLPVAGSFLMQSMSAHNQSPAIHRKSDNISPV